MIHERLDPAERRRNADRLRPKDFAGPYRLLVTTPEDSAAFSPHGIADPRVGEAVALDRDYLLEILADAATVASMIAESCGDSSREADFQAHVDSWRRRLTNLGNRLPPILASAPAPRSSLGLRGANAATHFNGRRGGFHNPA